MKKHYNILSLGISHKTASISIREKLAFAQDKIPVALHSLFEKFQVKEIVILSTCNRTELYCRINPHSPIQTEELIHWWHHELETNKDLTSYMYAYTDENAVKHLFSVASGLDSMILGEPQILGQLKTAYQISNRTGFMGKDLSRLFQLSFRTAKKIRTTTSISTYPVSVAFAAVSLAKKIFSDLSSATMILIGAGENTELILQHLLTKQIKRIVILNRTLEKAKLLANRYQVEYDALSSLSSWLTYADIVVSSVASDVPILKPSHVMSAFQGSKRRPMLMIDLGVPRNISPDLAENEDIYLYSVDDLESIVSQNKKVRERAAIEAESIVMQASEQYMKWIKSEKQIKAIRTLRQSADKIKQEAMRKAFRRLERGEDPKSVVELMLHQLTQKLMHLPTVHLRQASPTMVEEKIE